MTERDAFEIRLGAAVRGYSARVSSDLDPADLADRIAAAEPRRQGRAAALAVRAVAIPRVAWVLLLLALLITMVAGMLVAGAQRDQKLPAVVPPLAPSVGTPPPRVSVSLGSVPTCPPGSTPDEPGPVNQARPASVAYTSAAFDRRAGRLVVATGDTTGRETWTFDVCTNTWTRMHPNREPPWFTWRPLVYDADSDLTLGVAYGPDGAPPGHVWAYDLKADTWTEKGVVPGDATLRAYDPLSGLVLATVGLPDRSAPDGTAHGELSTYEVETDTWTRILEDNPLSAGTFAYDASVDRFITPGSTRESPAWLFDIRADTWSRSGAVPPVWESGCWCVPAIAYDETARRTVIVGGDGLAAYDATADRWETVAEARNPWGFSALPMAYDPVNGRLVGWGWGGAESDVMAFDLATREWTVLLEPSE